MEKYIEATLFSLISQQYPSLELIVVDGGSQDKTLQIIERYLPFITVLISEKDNGQYDAILKGFAQATGDIYCWLNADDTFFPWTLHTVARIFSENQDIRWLTGVPAFLNEDGSVRKIYNNASAKPVKAIRNGWFRQGGYGFLQQESMFWHKEVWQQCGGLDSQLKLAADYALWIRFARVAELWTVNLPLAAFRLRSDSRSQQMKDRYTEEVKQVCKDLKALPWLFRLLGNSMLFNYLLRLFTWKQTLLVHQPLRSAQMLYEKRVRSVSSLSSSALGLER